MRAFAIAGTLTLAVAVVWVLTRGDGGREQIADASPAPPSSTRAEEGSPSPARRSLLPATPEAPRDQNGALKVSKRPAQGEPVIKGAWGGKPGEFGRERDPEANAEVPMAIAAGKNGELLVVDQINHRVQRFKNGEPVGSIPIGDTVHDLAVAPDGRMVVLDRLVDKSVQLYDANGNLINEAPLAGKRLPEGGAATGVFMDDEGIWVERDHTSLVRVADAQGNADAERTELPGRPTRDGRKVVTAAITVREQGRLVVTAFDRTTLEPAWSRELEMPAPILYLVLLDSDADGNVYVGADVGREGTAEPFPIIDEAITVVRLNASGAITGTIDLPAVATGDEMHRPITVGDDGAIYALAPNESGMSVARYTFQ
jgi:outer membrane protein assembly factor BamB